MIEVADGLADLEVVLLGTAAAYGVAQQPIFELVSVNNLLKFAPGYGFDRDGKLIKPLNHEAPTLAIRRELTLQGWDGK
jgi:predicted HAD superfamily Cof-like phosphohydrolase